MAKKQPVVRDVLGVEFRFCPNDDTVMNLTERGEFLDDHNQLGDYMQFACPTCGYVHHFYESRAGKAHLIDDNDTPINIGHEIPL